MAVGMAGEIEHLITRVSMEGVSGVKRDQQAIGAGFKQLGVNIKGVRAEWNNLSATQQAGIGLGMTAAGVGMLAYMRQGARDADDMRQATQDLGRAIEQMSVGTAADAQKISDSLAGVPKVIPEFHKSMMQAGQSLVWAKAAPDDISRLLPAILDTTIAMKDMGKSMTVTDIAFGIQRAMVSGSGALLKQQGIILDDNIFKQKDWNALILAMGKYSGSAADELKELAGAEMANRNAAMKAKAALGDSLTPSLIRVYNAGSAVFTTFEKVNKVLGGVPGYAAAAVAGLVTVGGVVVVARVGVTALAVNWRAVALAANAATAAQLRAGAAGAAAGTAAGVGAAAGAGGLLAAGGAAAAIPVVGEIVLGALAVGGLAYGVNRYLKGKHAAAEKPFVPGGRSDPVASKLDKTNDLLNQIAGNTANFKVIGGGERARAYISEADEQRAIAGVLGRAIA